MLSSASTYEARGALLLRFCTIAASVRSFHRITGLSFGWAKKVRDSFELEETVAGFIVAIVTENVAPHLWHGAGCKNEPPEVMLRSQRKRAAARTLKRLSIR